jgi:hypothetical protein
MQKSILAQGKSNEKGNSMISEDQIKEKYNEIQDIQAKINIIDKKLQKLYEKRDKLKGNKNG